MRKIPTPALLAAVAVLAIAAIALFAQNQKTSAAYTEMKAREGTATQRYDQTIDAIAEIQDSLNAIAATEKNVRLSTDLQSEQKLTGDQKGQALDQIATLRASIMRNKARIEQLESSLKHSGIKVAGLQKMIKGLKTDVTMKEEQIAMLSGRVDSLQTEVTTLATTVQETQDTLVVRDQTLEERRRELATVYYIVGNTKQLKDAGAVVPKGGVLGINKTLVPAGGVSPGTYIPLDTDAETVVHIDASKAKVLSAQPASSYELRTVDGKVELHIIDPTAFRTVKQLVIQTA
jgi:uncharacterized coiled-coil protein SlyX